MKKILALVLFGTIVSLAIVGCGGAVEPTSAPAAEPDRTSRLATTAPEPEPTDAAVYDAAPEPEPTAEAVYDAAPEPASAATRRPESVPQATSAPQVQAAAPSSTNFQDYARQRFVSASVDNVSTFSLDTDRTSYFLALNWAQSGYEVNPDSVRA